MAFDDKAKTERLAAVRAEIARRLIALRGNARSAGAVSEAIKKNRGVVLLMEKGRINALSTLSDLLWEYGIGIDDFLASFAQQNVPEKLKDDVAKLKAVLDSDQTAQKELVHDAIENGYRRVQEVKARQRQLERAPREPLPNESTAAGSGRKSAKKRA